MKRLIDIVGSVLGLLLLSPLFLIVAILVRLKIGKPVIFCQPRAGLNGKEFSIYKFRSMLELRDPDGNLLPDRDRLTALGRFLRSASLDELPELWNVLKGEMSLVGPRPLLLEYLPLYNSEQARRHRVRPGITGWAQVKGRNALTWEERFRLDIWYVDHRGWRLDCEILLRTAVQVITRQGITAAGHASMPEFTGGKPGKMGGTD